MLSIIHSLDECREFWPPRNQNWRIFHDWDLRCALAKFDEVVPRFILDDKHGTVLPAAQINDIYVFFGGRHFNERNGFVGPKGGESEIFKYFYDVSAKVRLLSWAEDPISYLPPNCLHWDVPYNQYWEIADVENFASFLERVKPRTVKDYWYLERKFQPEVIDKNTLERMASFLDNTIDSFERRGARCAYSDVAFRMRVMLVASHFHERGMLRGVLAYCGGEEVGLAVFAEDKALGEAVFLFNLYKHSPSNISNCLVMAIAKHCVDNGLKLDGMRGAFSLKPRMGYAASPSYAVVNDGQWTIKAQSDLTGDELYTVYGRRFGAELSAQLRGAERS